MSNPGLCPHNQNPIACLTCFQAKQAPKPAVKPVGEAATSPSRQQPLSSHLLAQQAKKEQAFNELQANLAKLPSRIADALPDVEIFSTREPQEPDANASLDASTIQSFERMYPKRPSIIDRLPSHPDGKHTVQGTSARPVVTKGRRVSG